MLHWLPNSSCAFFFPGQGAQSLGMAADLIDAVPEARAVFDAGKELLGRDFAELTRNGPEEDLNSTRISQPAIFLHSMAALAVLGKRVRGGGRTEELLGACRDAPLLGAAGLSLGEYSALVFVGSLTFEDALRVVGKRGEYMQEACDASKGSMTSVIGLDAEKVEEVVASAKSEGLCVGVANYNSPEQTVISGAADAVTETAARLAALGAKRTVPLTVAGAYHSELMAPATRKLEPLLREVTILRPQVPFFANVSGSEVDNPEEIRQGLIRQIESPVRWRQTLDGLLERGLEQGLEIGPGKVIRGLVRNVSRSVKVSSAGTVAQLEDLLDKSSVE